MSAPKPREVQQALARALSKVWEKKVRQEELETLRIHLHHPKLWKTYGPLGFVLVGSEEGMAQRLKSCLKAEGYFSATLHGLWTWKEVNLLTQRFETAFLTERTYCVPVPEGFPGGIADLRRISVPLARLCGSDVLVIRYPSEATDFIAVSTWEVLETLPQAEPEEVIRRFGEIRVERARHKARREPSHNLDPVTQLLAARDCRFEGWSREMYDRHPAFVAAFIAAGGELFDDLSRSPGPLMLAKGPHRGRAFAFGGAS